MKADKILYRPVFIDKFALVQNLTEKIFKNIVYASVLVFRIFIQSNILTFEHFYKKYCSNTQ